MWKNLVTQIRLKIWVEILSRKIVGKNKITNLVYQVRCKNYVEKLGGCFFWKIVCKKWVNNWVKNFKESKLEKFIQKFGKNIYSVQVGGKIR